MLNLENLDNCTLLSFATYSKDTANIFNIQQIIS